MKEAFVRICLAQIFPTKQAKMLSHILRSQIGKAVIQCCHHQWSHEKLHQSKEFSKNQAYPKQQDKKKKENKIKISINNS